MITVTADYRLSEYLQVLRDFLPTVLRRDAEAKGKSYKGIRWYQSVLLYIIGPPAFAYKKARVGSCEFKINEDGISRISKTGEKIISWEEVKQVHELTGAYLIELTEGALPLPYRCFKPEELEAFCGYKISVKPNKSKQSDALKRAAV